MSSIKDVFVDVKSKIEEITEINHVAVFNNQIEKSLEDQNKELPFLYPACFIHFENIDYTDLPEGIQEGEGDMIVNVADWNLVESETNIFDLKTLVHQKIHLLKDTSDKYAVIRRDEEEMNTDHAGVNVYEMTYQIKFIDDTTQTQFTGSTINNLSVSGTTKLFL